LKTWHYAYNNKTIRYPKNHWCANIITAGGEFAFDATAGAQAKAGTEGTTAGASAGPATGKQVKSTYHKGMAVFIHTKGGLMYEAAIGGQKFKYTPN
jgi:hypothetical protein